MLTENFLRGRRRHEIAESDLLKIEESIAEVRDLAARKTVVRAGEVQTESLFLIEGLMCRYQDDHHGNRQILALHLPGDFVSLGSYPLGYADHHLATITPCRVGVVSHEELKAIERERPNLSHYFWVSTMLDAAMHREWIFRQGRLNAIGRLAHFFLETEARLSFIGRSEASAFDLPLLQLDLADIIGVTLVHLNRSLSKMRSGNMAVFQDQRVILLDRKILGAKSHFNDSYLT